MPTGNAKLITGVVNELKTYEQKIGMGEYYSGLAVLVRCVHDYDNRHKRTDSKVVEEVVTEVKAQDIRNGHQSTYFPYDDPNFPKDMLSQLPQGLADAGAKGNPLVPNLADKNISHEWTEGPGFKLFDEFRVKFKDAICGKDGPYERHKKGLIQGVPVSTAIAEEIMKKFFSEDVFWVPLSAYLGFLFEKHGLEAYCKS